MTEQDERIAAKVALLDARRAVREAAEPRFVLRWASEVLANPTRPKWLLRDTLEESVIGIIAGPRGTYKSFIALHWSLTVAAAGFSVVIVSAEGSGIDRRIRAWLLRHPEVDPGDLKLGILERRVNFNDEGETLELIAAIETLGLHPSLVVIDTVSKNSGSLDENENSDVKSFIGRLDIAIRRRWLCTVLLVHHTGHVEQGRARGASAWEADTDAAYMVKREQGTRIVSVSRERFKDSPDLEALAYEAEIVDLGEEDEFGAPVTSIALKAASPEMVSERKASGLPRGAGQRQLLAALRHRQAEAESDLIWTLMEIRSIAREIGLARMTAHEAGGAIAQFFMIPTVGGYRLPKKEEM